MVLFYNVHHSPPDEFVVVVIVCFQEQNSPKFSDLNDIGHFLKHDVDTDRLTLGDLRLGLFTVSLCSLSACEACALGLVRADVFN